MIIVEVALGESVWDIIRTRAASSGNHLDAIVNDLLIKGLEAERGQTAKRGGENK